VLGDQQFTVFAASIAQYRTLSLSYVNLSRRFQFALQGYSQTQFFYGQLGGAPLRSGVRAAHQPQRCRRDAHGSRRHGVRPSTRSVAIARVELSGGLVQIDEQYNDPGLQDVV
jgi:hypothetical protein